ncbi:MAG: AAA family ATPase [Prevotella sp.]|nr:AAA family ATPase [Prevotella sp.]
MEQMMRKYPVGIQTFSEIINGGYIYVDKTDLVWELVHYAKYIFMSRPRRFGKSLLTSTLESYFKGDRELFEGLKIMELEKEWTQYPVIHLDLSSTKGCTTPQEFQQSLIQTLKQLDIYEENADESTPGMKLDGLIRRLYKETGKQVVILIDNYDAALPDALGDQAKLDAIQEELLNFCIPLKVEEQYVEYCFITGITRFPQPSIFSSFNNIVYVSMRPKFASICGFTEHEVQTVFKESIEQMAKDYHLTYEEMFNKIKQKYGGYHFAEDAEEVFNPFSLLNALGDRQLSNYWSTYSTPPFLINQMQHFNTDFASGNSLETLDFAFDVPTENMHDALPLLYQSGYLTIKGYDREIRAYELAIPNEEVHAAYVRDLLSPDADKHTVDEWEVDTVQP